MFCRSWRPINPSEDVPFPPDRKYWRICFRPTKGVRCDRCTKALATHPDGKIRRALVREGGLDEETLRSLVFDRDAIVALHAKRQLEAIEKAEAGEEPELAEVGEESEPGPSKVEGVVEPELVGGNEASEPELAELEEELGPIEEPEPNEKE